MKYARNYCIPSQAFCTLSTIIVVLLFGAETTAQTTGNDESNETSRAAVTEPTDPVAGTTRPAARPAPPKLPEPKGAQRLMPKYDAWIDPKDKTVIVDGQVSLREGMLEMFACTRNTKEHESIVSANTKAFLVHTALLRLGADSGSPVQFVPTYKPPTGTEIDIELRWLDENGKWQTARAQDWVKDIRTGKAMTQPWVFAGSRFWKDEETGKEYYQAEGGDFICVSNFGTAMLDIPVESSQSNEELGFEAYTERIPPLGAPVRLVLKPKLEKHGAESSTQEDQAEPGRRPANSVEPGNVDRTNNEAGR